VRSLTSGATVPAHKGAVEATGERIVMNSSNQRTAVNADGVVDWGLPYPHAVKFGNLVFLSGQLGQDQVTGQPVDGGIQPQTRKVLENIKAVLEAAGTSMDMVLKTTCFLMDRNDFEDFNVVYREFFPKGKEPARSTFQVAKLAPGYIVEIEAIAGFPD
jgi:2-iminobutanoate/2-iminopropanoate deaminase